MSFLEKEKEITTLVFKAIQEILLHDSVATLFHDPEMLQCVFVDREKMKTWEGITLDG